MRIIRLHLEPGDVSLTKCSCILNSFFLFFKKKPTHIYCLLWFPYGIFYSSSPGAVFFPACCFYDFSLTWNWFFLLPSIFFFPRLPSLLVSSVHITLEIFTFLHIDHVFTHTRNRLSSKCVKTFEETSSTVEFLLLLYLVGWLHLLSAVSHILVWFIMHRCRLGL